MKIALLSDPNHKFMGKIDSLRACTLNELITFLSQKEYIYLKSKFHMYHIAFKEFDEAGDMVPVNVELVNHLWLPNIFIYNLKTFKVANILQSKDFQAIIFSYSL